MKGILTSLPLAFKMILRDPINLLLAIIPTVLALALYVFTIVSIFKNGQWFTLTIGEYFDSPDTATWIGRVLMALLILFVFLLMSWTFVVVVGIIAAPFNSMLSSRIERMLVGEIVETKASQTLSQMGRSLGRTFVNEFKKLFAIVLVGGLALMLNLVPVFYPIGLFLVATLLAVQFVDYSWSRHEMHFGPCLKDATTNLLSYSISGGFFLVLVTIPVINAFVPALATSYYTVLWLQRNNRLPVLSQK